jgi:ABC-type multidrug transport system fused ATPase/permease subunit
VTEKPDAAKLPRLRGQIEFQNVSFAYGSNPPLLRKVSVAVEPGQTLALVGPSGSGKTTLINLIPRFYDVTTGAVKVDGHDVRDVQLESLRSQIGMVMQETFLFNLTIRENISYGRSDATQDEIEAAAKAANAHDFIMELEEGYDTLTGERGTRLSGGQRQRIAIARAILVDPRILILDEATSSVDNRTDYMIRQALDTLMQGRTTIVIAHRLSTVQRAHQIAVMERGTITARGTHEELLRTSPLYQHLNEIQFQLQMGEDTDTRREGDTEIPLPASPRPPVPVSDGVVEVQR